MKAIRVKMSFFLTTCASFFFYFFPSIDAFAVDQSSLKIQISKDDLTKKLEEAEAFFESGQFATADRRVEFCFKNSDSLELKEKARLFLLKARLSFAFQHTKDMEFWLRQAHKTDSQAQVSRLKDPPELVSFWQKLKDEVIVATETTKPSSVEKQPTSVGPRSSGARELSTTTKQNEPSLPATVSPPPDSAPLILSHETRLKARFALGLMPFGVGHFVHNQVWPGASFMLAETSLFLLSSGLAESSRERAKEPGFLAFPNYANLDRFEAQARAYSLLGATGFVGLWGLEVWHLLPTLAQDYPQGAQWARFGLSFAPFGVAQFKNGENSKGIGLVAAESFFLLMSAALPRQGQRDLARAFFVGSLLFGMADGVLNHDWAVDPAKPVRWNLSFVPLWHESLPRGGFVVTAQRDFR